MCQPVVRPSAADRVRQAYARVAEADRPEVWITLRNEQGVLTEAAEVDRRVAEGEPLELAGLVFAVKDNIDVHGLPTTAGHPDFSYLPTGSATAVERLHAAGAVVLGKTNLDQFATGLVGTRSPYGAVRNARFPDRISGGSSSGSAVAVALGITDFALGTDTAGSGRVPAALNGLVGIKPTRGVVPIDGVVPACRSYDCVTAFAATVALACRVVSVMSGPSPTDPMSRVWPADVLLAMPHLPRVAVPTTEQLAMLSTDRWAPAVRALERAGALVHEIDITPLLAAAKLLYEGALVAERYAAFGEFIGAHPAGADPTVARIAAAAATARGCDVVSDQGRVARYQLEAAELLTDYDALLLPTAPSHPTLTEVADDPIGVNAMMGTFTNFMNLLDMAGLAVPAGETSDGLFGVTVVVRAFADQVAVDLASILTGEEPPLLAVGVGVELAVFGAHLRGEALNGQLTSRGARFLGPVRTSADYRMHALPGPVAKPGVIRVPTGSGVHLAGERWLLSAAGLGTFLAELRAPMSLGKITLDDSFEVLGFGCTLADGPDISAYGGWRAYVARTY
ncbi:MAG: allophanate hydrolase [Lapillicoccus sp.]